MTGFGVVTGESQAHSWTAELRSVNGKGLDIKIRVPDWIDSLEGEVRARLKQLIKRGNITLTIKLQNDESEQTNSLSLDEGVLSQTLNNIAKIEQLGLDQGVSFTPSKAADLLAIKGIMTNKALSQEQLDTLCSEILTSLDPLYNSFLSSRSSEGAQLLKFLETQLDALRAELGNAKALLGVRDDHMRGLLKTQLAKILENTPQFDAQRMAQEVALIFVKSDVAEELDRLAIHIQAASDLLKAGGAVGRRMEFLMQEFNREANTLCAKAQFSELTSIGLEMKVIIDQMREQIQNLE
ncbi:MAG: YicC/YloC family endoribonuclease [Paracoccaceae bacterium]